jgi:hypothetical protein
MISTEGYINHHFFTKIAVIGQANIGLKPPALAWHCVGLPLAVLILLHELEIRLAEKELF